MTEVRASFSARAVAVESSDGHALLEQLRPLCPSGSRASDLCPCCLAAWYFMLMSRPYSACCSRVGLLRRRMTRFVSSEV